MQTPGVFSTGGHVRPPSHALGKDKLLREMDAAGADCVVWGADLSRLRGTHRQAMTLFTEELDFLSASDKEWSMGRGIAEWLHWPLAK